MTFHLRQVLACVVGCTMASSAHEFYVYSGDLTESQVVPPILNASSEPVGTFRIRYDGDSHNGGPVAIYSISLPDLDLTGEKTPEPEDDLLALRIRCGALGETGDHMLNIFAGPGTGFRQDDAQLFVDTFGGLVEGAWDEQDQFFSGPGGTRLSTDSVRIGVVRQEIVEGRLYIEAVLGGAQQRTLRGQILGATSEVSLRYFSTDDLQLTMVSSSPRNILIESTDDWNTWKVLTNFVSGVGIVRWLHTGRGVDPQLFYRISESSVLYPFITTQPQDQIASAAGSVSFSVGAGGTLPLQAQWFRDGFAIIGETNLVLSLNDISVADVGAYYVVVSNLVGSATSDSVQLTVNP